MNAKICIYNISKFCFDITPGSKVMKRNVNHVIQEFLVFGKRCYWLPSCLELVLTTTNFPRPNNWVICSGYSRLYFDTHYA